jgi:hypothetical protein
LRIHSVLEASVRPSLLLLPVLLMCGCAPRADQVFTAPGSLVSGTSGAQPGYAIKLVRAKQAATEVVGDDGSLCRLTSERFATVDVGDWLACDWTIVPDAAETVAQAGAVSTVGRGDELR